jgi:hypothetical protein
MKRQDQGGEAFEEKKRVAEQSADESRGEEKLWWRETY